MALPHPHDQQHYLYLLDDALYCEEEHLDVEEEEDEGVEVINTINNGRMMINPCLVLLDQDLFWEEEELVCLFSKEQVPNLVIDSSLALARKEAVEWILRVDAHYGFSTLTAVLAVNYLDRFMSSLRFQRDKPWMTQLAAVACLSVAAKVEETQVPLLLDLQVEDTKYVFEAKTIQRMELLVLSTLDWKMNPVTPLSFLDHIIRRLGLKTNLHWEFMRRCELLLLSVIADSRAVCYQPSVLATATMLHVINQIETCNAMDYQNQLMGILKIDKGKLDDCCGFIVDTTLGGNEKNDNLNGTRKRKYEIEPSSPSGVIDASFSSDSSNDSWAVSSVSSSPKRPFKKRRLQDLQMPLPSFDVLITSPR